MAHSSVDQGLPSTQPGGTSAEAGCLGRPLVRLLAPPGPNHSTRHFCWRSHPCSCARLSWCPGSMAQTFSRSSRHSQPMRSAPALARSPPVRAAAAVVVGDGSPAIWRAPTAPRLRQPHARPDSSQAGGSPRLKGAHIFALPQHRLTASTLAAVRRRIQTPALTTPRTTNPTQATDSDCPDSTAAAAALTWVTRPPGQHPLHRPYTRGATPAAVAPFR